MAYIILQIKSLSNKYLRILLKAFRNLGDQISRQPVLWLICLVIGIKFALLAYAFLNFDFTKYPWENWLSIWSRWDSKAYLTIASEGYGSKSVAPDYQAFLSHFPPLYPLVIRFLSGFFNLSPILAGITISITASIGASYLLFKLVLQDFNNLRTAIVSVIFMNIYPISYFTTAVYSESLFIFFIILSFYLIRKENIISGGLAGAGAILTRVTGINIIPVYVFIILKKWLKGKLELKWLSTLIIISIGFGVYLLINQIYFGSYRFFLDESISFNWTKEAIFPMKETYHNLYYLVGHIADSFTDNYFMFAKGYNSIFTVLALIFIIVGITQKIPWDYPIYSVSSLLFFSSFTWGISDARYTLPIFSIYISMALIKKTWIKYILGFVFIFMLSYFTKVFTAGGWAF